MPGIKNKLFGGDGLFLARLTGQGTVWLQSISMAALARRSSRISRRRTRVRATSGGSAKGVGSLLS